LNFGADAFILKPAEPEDFLRRIREVQASGARVPPAVPSKPTLLKLYSEVLIRKLEEKSLRLEETNRELQRDIAERRRAEAEITKAVHDIVNSLLNGFQLVRLQAQGQLPEEILKLVDQMIEEASLKLDTLESLETVTESEMAISPGNGS
jgi:response regulator RpfG family c-di-GMP phosphodiesterase